MKFESQVCSLELAKMLIYLLENKIISVEEVNLRMAA